MKYSVFIYIYLFMKFWFHFIELNFKLTQYCMVTGCYLVSWYFSWCSIVRHFYGIVTTLQDISCYIWLFWLPHYNSNFAVTCRFKILHMAGYCPATNILTKCLFRLELLCSYFSALHISNALNSLSAAHVSVRTSDGASHFKLYMWTMCYKWL